MDLRNKQNSMNRLVVNVYDVILLSWLVINFSFKNLSHCRQSILSFSWFYLFCIIIDNKLKWFYNPVTEFVVFGNNIFISYTLSSIVSPYISLNFYMTWSIGNHFSLVLNYYFVFYFYFISYSSISLSKFVNINVLSSSNEPILI